MNIFGRKLNWGLAILLVFVAAMLAYRLTESPLTGYDEGILVQMAHQFTEIGSFALRITPTSFASGAYMTTAYPALFPVAVAMRLFGMDLLVARSVMALFSLGFIAAFYAVTARTFGKRHAWLATALMATHASFYVYGKPVMGEIPGLMYLMLFLLGLERLTRPTNRPVTLVALTSLALGLAAVTKPIFLLALPAAALTLLIARKRLPVNVRTIVAATATLLACWVVWLATQVFKTDDAAKVFLFYRNPYLVPDVIGTMLGNLYRLVTEATPLYLLILLAVWVVSLVLRARRSERLQTPVSPVELFGILFVGLILFAYLRTPGFYRYFFLANIAVYIALPFSIQDLLRRIVSRFPSWNARTVSQDLGIVLSVLLVLFQAFRLFHGSFITTTYASTQTAELTRYFDNDFPVSRQPYLYDVPEIAPFLNTEKYTQWIEVSGGGMFQVGVPLKEALPATPDTIIVHEHRYGLEKDLFPGYHQAAYVVRYVVLEPDAPTSSAR